MNCFLIAASTLTTLLGGLYAYTSLYRYNHNRRLSNLRGDCPA